MLRSNTHYSRKREKKTWILCWVLHQRFWSMFVYSNCCDSVAELKQSFSVSGFHKVMQFAATRQKIVVTIRPAVAVCIDYDIFHAACCVLGRGWSCDKTEKVYDRIAFLYVSLPSLPGSCLNNWISLSSSSKLENSSCFQWTRLKSFQLPDVSAHFTVIESL